MKDHLQDVQYVCVLGYVAKTQTSECFVEDGGVYWEWGGVLGAMGNEFVCQRSEEETSPVAVCEIMEML